VREIGLMRRLDRRVRIAFVDLTDENAPCPLDRTLLLARLHARENGRMLSGAAAFAAMWRLIPVLRPLGLLARNQIVLRGLERLYLLFLRFRPSIQRAVAARS
jgi:predicted DCC family thiol-disulfide oxidoreductase YuxK